MRPLLGCTTLLLALAPWATAAAPPASHRASDRLDYLFLGGDRPTLIRLHVRVGDKPYDAPWDDFMEELFAWFDKDGDGSLSAAEVARLPGVTLLLGEARRGVDPDTQGVPFGAIDANQDGKVSKEEFRAFYRNNGFPGMRFVAGSEQEARTKRVDELLYQRLAKAGGGRLTADGVAGMYEKLRALDVNEDEMLDQGELFTRARTGRGTAVGPPRAAARVEDSSLARIEPDREASLVARMMRKYDRNKDGRLSAAEVGLPPALFARLDADGDGFLDAGESWAFLATPPDLVMRLQAGPRRPRPRLVVIKDETPAAPANMTPRRGRTGDTGVQSRDARLSFRVADTTRSRASPSYLREFDVIAGKKGYVDRPEGKGPLPDFFSHFSQADKDGDGRLTRAELVAWLDLVAAGRGTDTVVRFDYLGRGIFPFLDADGDGRLSLREMRAAWSRLEPFARGGGVTTADLPRHFRIAIGSGEADSSPAAAAIPGTTFGPPPGTPAWFRKMDRNGDGDVSRREWLGTDEEFRAIDADGDGLISADEATAFEAKKKTKDEE